MNVICLAIDRLHSGFLGAYGNTWVDTPALNRLATQSLVFDQALIDTPQTDAFYRSFWRDQHALANEQPGDRMAPTLPEMLREAGIVPTLMTDAKAVYDHPLADAFENTLVIDPPWDTQGTPAESFEETHLARCFAEITDWLAAARGPFMLHCHISSLGLIWDAPSEFRESFWVDDDLPPLETSEVPDQMLADDYDADELMRYAQAYAGQLLLFDTCLAGLIEAIDEHTAGRDTVFALIGTRGFPMGEHRRLGPCDEALYGEHLHVPLMLRSSATMADPGRSQRLVEPSDLTATMLEVCGRRDGQRRIGRTLLDALGREHACPSRDRLVTMGNAGERSIRTPAWFLRCGPERGVGPVELYTKPDDRWEANNVAVRCRDVVDGLLDALEQYERAAENKTLHELPPLDAVLVEGLD